MYIDIHTHLLPGVDDGAQTPGDTRAMLERYNQLGFSDVIPTPHWSVLPEGDYIDHVNDERTQTQWLAARYGIRTYRGAELRLTPEVREIAIPVDTTLAGAGDTVLVDFPSGVWPFYAEEALFQVQTQGFTPILAHPERYGSVDGYIDVLRGLVDRGVLLQVTLGSFTSMFGRKVQSLATSILDAGLVHVVATDAHGAGRRMEAAVEGMDWIRSKHGEAALQVLLVDHPSRLLSSQPLPRFRPEQRKRSWSSVILPRSLHRGR